MSLKANKYNPIIGDEKDYDPTHLLGLAENYCIWGSNHFADKLPNSRGWIVWDKIDGVEGTSKNFSDIADPKAFGRYADFNFMGKGGYDAMYRKDEAGDKARKKVLENKMKNDYFRIINKPNVFSQN